ncbi:Uma2 family endonuclease [Roseofilum sp. BLCC_M91]|uniref:Uma2 family endonuclease n=1 Tax=Roseofilum halophilum BLCC-M91 TaxID=3022259 RepID=A0ABT7BKR5_9CYAN|nr:Uma2 family endonuclease [Roseofilum halophilum]MDJ1179761.1 Uma2 family endonuclease [Roseofilum halophilum BLCC-M91]
MTSPILPQTSSSTSIIYPSENGEPIAETYDHIYAILTTLQVLKTYLAGQQATVLANQFLYYSKGFPQLRMTPDVMVIFDVEPGDRDNYKVWEEGQVPKVIFEMTSESTKNEDLGFKKEIYEQLEVEEYWLFDPKGEWIEGQLEGYRLVGETYQPITDRRSQALNLRLFPEGNIIEFYREEVEAKLLMNDALMAALQAERQAKKKTLDRLKKEQKRVEDLEAILVRYQEKFGHLEQKS